MEHPIWDSLWRKVITIAGVFIVAFVQALFLWEYTDATFSAALLDGFLSILLFATLAYWAWYIVSFMDTFQAQVIVMILALSLWSLGGFAVQDMIVLITDEEYISFVDTLPFRLIFATPTWCGVMLWYRIQSMQLLLSVEGVSTKEEIDHEESLVDSPHLEEPLDRITIKNGAKIHLVAINDVRYIQACGDYVNLVTAEGQYLKEQTMKYFEAHLPQALFVRIHRSTIVNVTQISRVELFGKDNYCLLLKSGDKLKVSLSGYKLLRERLNL